jgi:hypothetical protein
VLRANGLPGHVEEPGELPPHEYRCELVGTLAGSWLHCLRRLHALILQNGSDPGWWPDPAPEDCPGRDPLLDRAIDRELTVYIRSHLIVHADAEGWYVPIDFEDMLYDDGAAGLPGGILGSSPRLLAELRSIAPWLGISSTPRVGSRPDRVAAQQVQRERSMVAREADVAPPVRGGPAQRRTRHGRRLALIPLAGNATL